MISPVLLPRLAAAPASAPAEAPTPATPTDTVEFCSPAVKQQVDTLMANAEADVDSGTMAYGMGFCVGAMAGLVAGQLHPLLGVAIGGAVLAGGFMLGRRCDREAAAYARQAGDLNARYHCY